MISLFTVLVDALQASIFTLGLTFGGSLPAGILATTLLVRIGLLPFTWRLALRSRRRARVMASLRSRLDALRMRWADDPGRRAEETLALYRSRGVPPMDGAPLVGALLQVPIVGAFFRAVRGVLPALQEEPFLWIRDLARPSPLLAVLAAALALLATAAAGPPPPSQPEWFRWVPAAGTLATLLFVSSGFGLYLLASTAVSSVQGALVRRAEDQAGG